MRPRAATRPGHRGGQQRTGYSLVEVVGSLTVFIAILLGVFFIFIVNYRSARGRSDTAKRQETLRGAQHDLARLVRMADSSGLPRGLRSTSMTTVHRPRPTPRLIRSRSP